MTIVFYCNYPYHTKLTINIYGHHFFLILSFKQLFFWLLSQKIFTIFYFGMTPFMRLKLRKENFVKRIFTLSKKLKQAASYFYFVESFPSDTFLFQNQLKTFEFFFFWTLSYFYFFSKNIKPNIVPLIFRTLQTLLYFSKLQKKCY